MMIDTVGAFLVAVFIGLGACGFVFGVFSFTTIGKLSKRIEKLEEEKPMDLEEELQIEQEPLEEAARHVYESWMGGTMDDVRRDMVELGRVINARQRHEEDNVQR